MNFKAPTNSALKYSLKYSTKRLENHSFGDLPPTASGHALINMMKYNKIKVKTRLDKPQLLRREKSCLATVMNRQQLGLSNSSSSRVESS